MERRAFLAIAISLAILLLYQGLILPYLYPPRQGDELDAGPEPQLAQMPDPDREQQEQAAAPAPEGEAPQLPADDVTTPARRVTIENDHFIAILSSRGARFESFALKRYRATVDPESPPQELIPPGGSRPIEVELRGRADTGTGLTVLADANAPYRLEGDVDSLQLSGEQSAVIAFSWPSPAGVIRKEFRFHGNRPDFELGVEADDVAPQYSEVGISFAAPTKSNGEVLFDRAVYLQKLKLIERHFDDSNLTEGEIVSGDPGWSWAGIAGPYFVAALVPIDTDKARLWLKQREQRVEEKILVPLAGGDLSQDLLVYIGSKRMETLQEVGHNLPLAVDLGWFKFIAEPLLAGLRWSHGFTGNYGVDIILLTVLIKILFLPLTRKSFESMRAMQKLQPHVTQLRERLKDKPEQMNKEMMELYRRHNVNPLGGCLPMLVQIPVFIGLYQALLQAVELRHAPFMLWIDDLSAPDRLGNLAIPFIDPPGIPVLTLIMGASMFLQQLMTPSTGDPTQRQMMMIMPVIFTFMFVTFPAGLVLYWTVNNVLTVAQQYYISRRAT